MEMYFDKTINDICDLASEKRQLEYAMQLIKNVCDIRSLYFETKKDKENYDKLIKATKIIKGVIENENI